MGEKGEGRAQRGGHKTRKSMQAAMGRELMPHTHSLSFLVCTP